MARVLLQRDAELATLRRQIEEVHAHEGRVIVVEGPAGMGKSALIADRKGRRVLVQRTGSEEARARNEDEANGYGAKNVKDVKCNGGPSPTVKKGDTFNCEVSIDGTKRQVTVTFQDDKGTYEVGRPK